MSHNRSQRALRNAVLATPIAHYRTCYLVLTCPSCRDRRELRIEPLITDARGAETVEQFLMRLRCRTCGNLPDTVKLQPKPGQVSASREILIVGPGAY